PGELATVLDDARPRLVLTTGDGVALPGPAVRLGGAEGPAWLRSGETVTDAELAAARDRVEPGDPAALVHTSGSSGRPKGALLPHRALVRCALVQGTHVLDPGIPPVVVNNLPVNHVACLGDVTAAVLVAGGTVVLQDRFDPPRVLAALGRERVTVWGGVPAMFALCVADPAFATADLSSVRRIVTGGGPMPLPLARALTERGPRLVNLYGLTETVGNVTFTGPDDDLATITGTIGRPDPRYRVDVVRPDGSLCADGEVGEIRVGGDARMTGYLGRPEATAAAFDSRGRLRSGDLAHRRTDGALVLAGRLSERFKSGGYNVDPREVEEVLERHPGVRLAAVVGVPDPLYGEVGHAFVAADPAARGTRVTAESLRTHARAHLANYKVPKRIEVRPELPLLAVGKVDKIRLRQEVRS
ncbi:MAG TPA: AMP-binding protein, partial [Pseudonocardia sp.]|nr:AMP-binding protein [Pseudonocardia sp.]